MSSNELFELRVKVIAAIKAGKFILRDGETISSIRSNWSAELCQSALDSIADTPALPKPPAALPKPHTVASPETSANALMDAIKAIALSATPAAAPIDLSQITALISEQIAAAQLPRTVQVKFADREPHNVGLTHARFDDLLTCLSAKLNVWLCGPSGTGKTHAAHQAASALGVDFYSVGACIMPSDLLGYRDAVGTYHDTGFTKAFKFGGLCMLDEADAYSERASLALNEALSNGSITLGGERFKRHADFLVVLGSNTWGNGASAKYSGRARMDEALKQRFPARLFWDYDSKLENAATGNEYAYALCIALRLRLQSAGVDYPITLRHMTALAALLVGNNSVNTCAKLLFGDLPLISEACAKLFSEAINEA